MKSTTIKPTLVTALVLFSLSCFLYVNTTSLDRTLKVESVPQSTVETAENVGKNAKMPDLTLLKNVLTLIQTFFPAK